MTPFTKVNITLVFTSKEHHRLKRILFFYTDVDATAIDEATVGNAKTINILTLQVVDQNSRFDFKKSHNAYQRPEALLETLK